MRVPLTLPSPPHPPFPPPPPPLLQVTSQPSTWTKVPSSMTVICPKKCTIRFDLLTHLDCGCLNGLIFFFFRSPFKRTTTKQKNANAYFARFYFPQLFRGLTRLVGLVSLPYQAGLAYALFPLELPLCLYEKGGWLACRDPGCSSLDITKRASPPLHIRTTTTLRTEPVGKAGQPELLTELAHPIQTCFKCILYCITQMALM